MQKELIKEIISNVVGKSVEKIADLLDSKKYTNEFVIADKLEITINQTRNILYKLSDLGLVSSTRKKDKKKGWYTYFWKLEDLKAMEFLKNILDKKIEQVRSQISSRETKQFYVCERCKLEFTEENALFMDFTCRECGDVFTLKDNTKTLRELKKQMVKLEKDKVRVEEEIKKEKEKIDKQRAKVFAKEKRVKEKLRAAKRKAKIKIPRPQKKIKKNKKLHKKKRH